MLIKRPLLTMYLSLLLGGASNINAADVAGFNNDWLFTETDSLQYPFTTYCPANWRNIDLPHDWTIEHKFDKNLEGCTAFAPGGIGWYSKIFNTAKEENQKFYIIFDGVYNNADFWLNGMKLGSHPYGYAPIYYDLTDLLQPKGGENRFSVRVDHSRYADSRWYTGSGIYRNVEVLVVDKFHIPVWGVYITTPTITKDNASVDIQVNVNNDYNVAKKGVLVSEIVDKNGKIVDTQRTNVTLAAGEKNVYNQKGNIINPIYWDINNPYLYTVKSYIEVDGKPLDVRNTRIGVRTIKFDKDKGFFLNGNNVKIKGVCLHHDAGIVGTAVPKDVWYRRLKSLKDAGCNAIRTSHNQPSQEFLDLCDELGLMVQNEFYDEWDLPKDKRYNMQDKEVDYITRGNSEHFQEWGERDLKNCMLASRNHASVFQWSIGNEIEWTYPGTRQATGIFKGTDENDKMDWTLWRTEIPPHTPQQVRDFWAAYPKQTFNIGTTAAKLAKWTRELDVTRPVTANCILPTSSFETGYTDVLDVVGFSYKPAKYDYFKATYPDKVMMGTENVPRWYEWKAAIDRDFISGIFLWTGIDYLGERRANQWPQKATAEGLLDVAGFERGSYYMYKSLWRDDIPVLAIYSQTAKKSIYKEDGEGNVVEKKKDYWKLAPRVWQDVNPYWSYADGEKTIVEVYSNCDAVELFQNGKSLGKKYLKDQADRTYKWAVTYKKGKIEAVGYKGKTKTKALLETVGAPAAIRLTADKSLLNANNIDVAHIVAEFVDKNGKVVKNFDTDVTFDVKGDYRFLGTDCGDTRKMEGYKSKTTPTDFGKCLLEIQSTKVSNKLVVSARTSDGKLLAKDLIIEVK